MNGDTTPVLPMSDASLSRLSALLVRLKAQGLNKAPSVAILQRWAVSKKATRAADDRALRAALRERCRLVKRGEVVFPCAVEIRAPRTPAAVTVPAPTRPRPWWRLW